MSNLFIRTYSFVDGTTAYGSQVEAEIGNVVTVLNNLNTAATNWGQVSSLHATNVPLIADCSSGSQHIADFKNNSVIKASVSSTGLVTCVGAALSSQKITGLLDGSAVTDGATVGQIVTTALTGLSATSGTITSASTIVSAISKLINARIVQVTLATSTTQFSTTSSTFQATNLSGSITPTATTSKILILTCASGQVPAGHNAYATLERGGSNLGGTLGFSQLSCTTTAGINAPLNIMYLDSPSSTSALTYQIYLKNDDNAATVLHGFTNQTQVMVLIEIGVGS